MKNTNKISTEKSEKEIDKFIKKVSLNLYQITKNIQELNTENNNKNDINKITDAIKKCDKELLHFFNVKFTKKSKENLLNFFN